MTDIVIDLTKWHLDPLMDGDELAVPRNLLMDAAVEIQRLRAQLIDYTNCVLHPPLKVGEYLNPFGHQYTYTGTTQK